jgi:hypothetical protein
VEKARVNKMKKLLLTSPHPTLGKETCNNRTLGSEEVEPHVLGKAV